MALGRSSDPNWGSSRHRSRRALAGIYDNTGMLLQSAAGASQITAARKNIGFANRFAWANFATEGNGVAVRVRRIER